MTPEEREMLSDLANKIAQTPAPPRDAEAEEFIRTRIGSRPDALYLMTQTVLVQNMALEQAQRQLQDLQQRYQSGQATGGSFLGQAARPGAPGLAGQPSQGGASPYSGGGYAAQPQYAGPQPQYAPPQYAPSPSGGPSGSGGPSFLRGAAQTAAGVAAGALAFEGIRSLFSHPGYGGLGGFGGGSGLMGAPVEETVVNNYYDSPGEHGRDQLASENDYDKPDQLTDASYDDTDDAQLEDASYDSGDDGGGFDSDDTFA